MDREDRNDIAAALAHITRLGMRHSSHRIAFAMADVLFELCQVEEASSRQEVIADAGRYFTAMEVVQ